MEQFLVVYSKFQQLGATNQHLEVETKCTSTKNPHTIAYYYWCIKKISIRQNVSEMEILPH